MKEILFSGIQPTGEIHLGNYLGALKNWVALQKEYSCIYSIVDYHALTGGISADELRTNTIHAAIDILALGVDPKKAILFRQSDVMEHLELSWIFSCLTPVPELERMTQYKDKQAQGKTANAGLLTYPVLQAADILLYKASRVPVGEDQLQHLELARIIARKFNHHYHQEYFPEVKPVLADDVRVMSLTNPQKKMSKSLGPKAYIALRDNPDTIRQKISKAVTDSLDPDNSTLSGGHNLLMLYKQFATLEAFQHAEQAYQLKKLSYAELKQNLTNSLVAFLQPIQEKQTYYLKHPKVVAQILRDGAERAQAIARKNIKEIRKIVGLV